MADTGCPRLPLERFAAGELTGEAAKALETHIGSCARCATEYAQMKKDQAEFLRIHPFADLRATGAIGQSSELWYERFVRMFAAPVLRPVLIPVCIAALVAIAIVPLTGKRGLFDASIGSDIRYKGSAGSLTYIYKRGGTVYERAPDDRFAPGDKIQLFYDSRSDQYLALFSVSADGKRSFYHPEDKAQSCSIRSGVGNRLAWPVGIELDSAVGDELVVAVYSAAPLETATVSAWVDRVRPDAPAHAALGRVLERNPPVAASVVATLLLKKELPAP